MQSTETTDADRRDAISAAHVAVTGSDGGDWDLDSFVAEQRKYGFQAIEMHPHWPELKVGTRVHNRGEQFYSARNAGTATVAAIMRRGTDDRPDSWEKSYGRPNIEVIVMHDRGYVTSWADYGTEIARGVESLGL